MKSRSTFPRNNSGAGVMNEEKFKAMKKRNKELFDKDNEDFKHKQED